MNDDLLKYQIGITQIKGIGTNLARTLIAYTGSPEAVFKEKQTALAKIPGIGETLSYEIVQQGAAALMRAVEEVEFILKNKITATYFTDRNYPFRLKECTDAPLLLFSKGSADLNKGKFIGIVGTRNATDYGKEMCRKLIEDLSAALPETVIVSGLAYGIDIAAHKAALNAALPTIGVVGHGLDRIYPAVHRPFAVKMVENGGLLTEYLSRTNPDRPNFVQRNRIIAGLSDVTIVVESAIRGGALLTVEAAGSYNRDVFAFPGRTTDEYSAGCNMLIKYNKAGLIESADDLMRAMNWTPQPGSTKTTNIQTTLFMDLSDDEQQIVTQLRQHSDGIQVNELAILSGLPFSRISALLLEMEFKGVVKCLPGSIYKAVK